MNNIEDNNNKPTVFISYSHKDEIWKERLVPHLGMLEKTGRIVVWSDSDIDQGDKWYEKIKDAMSNTSVAVCLISADYLYSDFVLKEEIPDLLERMEKQGMHLLPVLLRQCAWEAIDWIKDTQMLPGKGQTVSKDYKEDWDEVFAQVAKNIFKIIDNPKFTPPAPTIKYDPPEKVDTYRLPQTGSELFGRQEELKILDDAWESTETNIITFVAWGGVGKSTLINKWVERMAADNFRGANKVFAWSFYSQGTNDRVTSADTFLNEALEWFGDPDPKAGSVWAKGERLAKLVNEKKTLLLLDGLEPLQSGLDFEKGKIKDAGLAMLLKRLAKKNNGLCVVTTREEVFDLKQYETTVKQIDLEQITPEAGRALLRVAGVNGTDVEIEESVEKFGGHALAISLLAAWLKDIKGHHIREAANIPDLNIPVKKGKHPRRIMAAFEERFGNGPENELLQILGLFDRPAGIAAINKVKDAPAITGLTDKLQKIDKAGFNKLCDELRRLKLVAPKSIHNPDVIDCHPLAREHFGEKLQFVKPEAFKEAHNRLYEHYCDLPEKELPDTLEEMAPLFIAVTHGCKAGRHQEVMEDVYWKQIRHSNESYCCAKLGAFGSDLAALSNFFDVLWSKPAEALSDNFQAAVLSWAGFGLRALNRLREAAEPLRAGLEARFLQKSWENTAISTGNLSELHLTLGDVQKAVDYGRQSVEYADKSGDGFMKEVTRTAWADALHQAGDVDKAEELFMEAENIQKERTAEDIYLYSLPGFRFCDLLLSKGLYEGALKRSEFALVLSIRNNQLLSIALDTLTLGRAYLIRTVKQDSNDFTQAEDYMNRAVDGLRKAGQIQYLPLGLLARASLFREQGLFNKAWADLDEAYEISEMGEQKLNLTDYHLESCRLFMAEGKAVEARGCLDKAMRLIDETGYGRRIPEAAALEKRILNFGF